MILSDTESFIISRSKLFHQKSVNSKIQRFQIAFCNCKTF